jgi:hypothetical protein
MHKNSQIASAFFAHLCGSHYVRKKPQIAASLPSHVAEEIEKHGLALELSKGEYLALIAKDWFARGCPPVTPEEKTLRERTSTDTSATPSRRAS